MVLVLSLISVEEERVSSAGGALVAAVKPGTTKQDVKYLLVKPEMVPLPLYFPRWPGIILIILACFGLTSLAVNTGADNRTQTAFISTAVKDAHRRVSVLCSNPERVRTAQVTSDPHHCDVKETADGGTNPSGQALVTGRGEPTRGGRSGLILSPKLAPRLCVSHAMAHRLCLPALVKTKHWASCPFSSMSVVKDGRVQLHPEGEAHLLVLPIRTATGAAQFLTAAGESASGGNYSKPLTRMVWATRLAYRVQPNTEGTGAGGNPPLDQQTELTGEQHFGGIELGALP